MDDIASRDLASIERNEQPLHIRSFLMKGSRYKLQTKDQIARLIANLKLAKSKDFMNVKEATSVSCFSNRDGGE